MEKNNEPYFNAEFQIFNKAKVLIDFEKLKSRSNGSDYQLLLDLIKPKYPADNILEVNEVGSFLGSALIVGPHRINDIPIQVIFNNEKFDEQMEIEEQFLKIYNVTHLIFSGCEILCKLRLGRTNTSSRQTIIGFENGTYIR
ncbi:hypothetical protein, partial [Leptospira kmetyi]